MKDSKEFEDQVDNTIDDVAPNFIEFCRACGVPLPNIMITWMKKNVSFIHSFRVYAKSGKLGLSVLPRKIWEKFFRAANFNKFQKFRILRGKILQRK